ncbi:hypothetical protein OIU85_001293 [Salix viminalis]|uniref:Protein EARLY FLOWERING 4 domain-containing protein n=1 Tax=Salix viminalis TaxID=40686 RepID=A0A9Q0VM30_SALVM|nr:hypothetical protein OIU85_001293 [Salix viminalis]
MVTTAVHKSQQQQQSPVLIVGNYCHDVLIQNNAVKAVSQLSLGGAASFISNVFNGMSISCNLVSKVGEDFKYPGHQDRILKRVCACDPIRPSDLPDTRSNYGMAVGVGGEILPETLERMIEICDVVFVDIQALIRVFDSVDGTVKLVKLVETGFYPLLPRIGVSKGVIGGGGVYGCGRDGELGISPFLANQEDPTGAGDSFFGGFVAGLVQGLAVPDAALLGNLFGSLSVEQIGLPKFDARFLQRVNDEVQKRKMQCLLYERSDDELKFLRPEGHEQFHALLAAEKSITPFSIEEHQWNSPSSTQGNCCSTLESSSLVEEEQVPTLDNNTGTAIAPPKPYKKGVKDGGGEAKNGEEEAECDVEAWDTLSKSFKQVQSVLDHNRDLIQQVNSNHRSKIPDNLVKNVSLIREINGNISKVISIYSDLSVNFSNIVQERRRVNNGGESNLENTSNES